MISSVLKSYSQIIITEDMKYANKFMALVKKSKLDTVKITK